MPEPKLQFPSPISNEVIQKSMREMYDLENFTADYAKEKALASASLNVVDNKVSKAKKVKKVKKISMDEDFVYAGTGEGFGEKDNENPKDAEAKLQNEIAELKKEISRLEREYKDRSTGISGFKDKDNSDPIEASIEKNEANIKNIEAEIRTVKNGGRSEEVEIHGIENGESVDNEILQSTEDESLPREESSNEIVAEAIEDEKKEEVIPNIVEIPVEVTNVVEEMKKEEAIGEIAPGLQEERESLQRELAEAQEQLNGARSRYFDYYNQREKEYTATYKGLFRSHLEKVAVAMLADKDLLGLKAEYEKSLLKYREVYMKDALYGLEGEKLERERVAREIRLKMLEGTEVFDARTNSRAKDIEPQKGWFAKKSDEAKTFMKKNSRLLKNAIVGALIFGSIFGASKLQDVEKADVEPIKSPPPVALKAEIPKAPEHKIERKSAPDSDDSRQNGRVTEVEKPKPIAPEAPVQPSKKEVSRSADDRWSDLSIKDGFGQIADLNQQYRELVDVARETMDNDPAKYVETTGAMEKVDTARKQLRIEVAKNIFNNIGNLRKKMLDDSVENYRSIREQNVNDILSGNNNDTLNNLSKDAQEFIRSEASKVAPNAREPFSSWTERIEKSKWNMDLLKAV